MGSSSGIDMRIRRQWQGAFGDEDPWCSAGPLAPTPAPLLSTSVCLWHMRQSSEQYPQGGALMSSCLLVLSGTPCAVRPGRQGLKGVSLSTHRTRGQKPHRLSLLAPTHHHRGLSHFRAKALRQKICWSSISIGPDLGAEVKG